MPFDPGYDPMLDGFGNPEFMFDAMRQDDAELAALLMAWLNSNPEFETIVDTTPES
jgi:hypothetical protein